MYVCMQYVWHVFMYYMNIVIIMRQVAEQDQFQVDGCAYEIFSIKVV